jgi:hypothetical protein
MIKFALVIVAAAGSSSGVAIDTSLKFSTKAACEAAAALVEKETDTNIDTRVFSTRAACVEVK